MFLPTTTEDIKKLGWKELDIILVSGDTYIDSPFFGTAVIGKLLLEKGYRVGIIAQPDVTTEKEITRLGAPALFWGVTSGCVDSMLSNYTASKKRRNQDDLTPGGVNDKRPDRALIVYANLIRHYFKDTVPIVLGGIDASLRRIAHYDYWSNKIRGSVLFDSKADALIYGMGEKAVLALAEKLRKGEDMRDIRGICIIGKEPRRGFVELPAYEEVSQDKEKFSRMFRTFYENNDPITARGLIQRHGDRYLIHNPPQPPLTTEELDRVHNLEYERAVHPYYGKAGRVKALETIRFSITTHRGCYGECNFCAIAIHQGRAVISRSEGSILKEAEEITKHPGFKGIINDVGGPTANMYGSECGRKLKEGGCKRRRCLYPSVCRLLKVSHQRQINLLRGIRKLPYVKEVFVASGIRYDLVLNDREWGEGYMRELVVHHISGQMKIAPEHTEEHVLELMGKPSKTYLIRFRELFNRLNKETGKRQFLTYYFIAAYPGCDMKDMIKLKAFVSKELRLRPEQVQIFTPAPSTYAALMYWTGVDPFSGNKIFVERDIRKKEKQKGIMK